MEQTIKISKERKVVIDLVSRGLRPGDEKYDKAWKEYTDTFPEPTRATAQSSKRNEGRSEYDKQLHNL